MLLVIFGAGASYDSVDPAVTNPIGLRPGTPDPHLDNYRPPLAKDLFADWHNYAEFIDMFPACRPIVQRMRQRALSADFNVERELEAFQTEAERYPPRWKQLAAIRYYLQHLLWECGSRTSQLSHGLTNYLRFLDRVDYWRLQAEQRVIIVTFNYDTLLEQALADAFGIKFQAVEDYGARRDYRIYKLHGSVNWGKRVRVRVGISVPPKITWQHLQDEAASLQFTGEYEIMKSPLDIKQSMGHALFPAIAVPFERKYDFECPQDQLSDLFTSLEEVTDVLIVGWRATEQHFLERLTDTFRSSYNRLTVIAGGQDSADHTISNLTKVGITRNLEATPFGFSEFSRTGIDEWLGGIDH